MVADARAGIGAKSCNYEYHRIAAENDEKENPESLVADAANSFLRVKIKLALEVSCEIARNECNSEERISEGPESDSSSAKMLEDHKRKSKKG
jgi:hypothetical protein